MTIIHRREARVILSPHQSQIRPLMDRTNSPITQCSLAEEILQPGNAVAPHRHRQTEEIYYIVQGAGVMMVGRETARVKVGDAIFIPKGKMHSLRNTGKTSMKILLVCGPAFDPADVIRTRTS